MHSRKTFAVATIVAIAFLIVGIASRKKAIQTAEVTRPAIPIKTQSVSQSTSLAKMTTLPATVVGESEVSVTAKTSGTVTSLTFDFSKYVPQGSTLAIIDDSGANLAIGSDGLRSSSAQIQDLAAEQAKQALALAKKNYQNLKDLYDAEQKNQTIVQGVTKVQVDSAKKQVDIAQIQYRSAQIGAKGSLDAHFVISPLSGYVTNKYVSVGDSVVQGQKIATISKTNRFKIQFYVNQEDLAALTVGQNISLNDGVAQASIKNIGISADPTTKRFLVEALLERPSDSQSIQLGTIIDVSYETVIKPQRSDLIILPLSAITISQNGSFVMVAEGNMARKHPVTVEHIDGEIAQISTDLAPEQLIIIEGNKLLTDRSVINRTN